MREAVSDVIALRAHDARGLSRMISWSLAVHVGVLAAVAIAPRGWLERQKPTEHVMVPRLRAGQADDAETLILKAIDQKRDKGDAAYAAGKTLIVFLDAGAGTWFPNRVARRLPDPLHFAAVWVVGLQGVEASEYVYGVTNLDLIEGNAPTLLVRIKEDFGAWEVTRTQ